MSFANPSDNPRCAAYREHVRQRMNQIEEDMERLADERVDFNSAVFRTWHTRRIFAIGQELSALKSKHSDLAMCTGLKDEILIGILDACNPPV